MFCNQKKVVDVTGIEPATLLAKLIRKHHLVLSFSLLLHSDVRF